jgi:phage FluMu protein Com
MPDPRNAAGASLHLDPPSQVNSRCPHCKKVNPGHGIHFAGGPIPGIGYVDTVEICCASCKAIFNVHVLNVELLPELRNSILAARAAAMREMQNPPKPQ